LINPFIDQVTDLVVKENTSPNTEYIVPINFVTETTAEMIRLRCSKAEMEMREPFIKTTFVDEKMTDINNGYDSRYGSGSYYDMPYVTPEVPVYESKTGQQITVGKMAVRRGTPVEATDGYVGKVDEFVVNRDGHISHLVMREGHLWGKKDVIIPLSALDNNHNFNVRDSLFLKLSKLEVESLPTFPMHRDWA
jgi:hypothetical protein